MAVDSYRILEQSVESGFHLNPMQFAMRGVLRARLAMDDSASTSAQRSVDLRQALQRELTSFIAEQSKLSIEANNRKNEMLRAEAAAGRAKSDL